MEINEMITVLEELKNDYPEDSDEYADVSQTIYYLNQKYK